GGGRPEPQRFPRQSGQPAFQQDRADPRAQVGEALAQRPPNEQADLFSVEQLLVPVAQQILQIAADSERLAGEPLSVERDAHPLTLPAKDAYGGHWQSS